MAKSLLSKLAGFLLLFSFSTLTVLSQEIDSDTILLSKAIKRARAIHTLALESESHLFNGVQYKGFVIHNYDIGYPYFGSDDWIDGSVIYDGQLFTDLSLQYDLVHDKVIVEHTFSHFSIQLIDEKLKSFTLGTHKFVSLKADDSVQSQMIRPGHYEVLYDGKVKVYAKRKKEINSIVETPLIKQDFVDKNQFFVYKNGSYFNVKNKSSILKVFGDKKSALRKYINKNKLNFRKDRDFALAAAAKFYDESE